jgi:heme exporter protein B
VNAALALLRRDLRLALRQSSDAAMAVFFFLLTATLVPLGVGPEPQILARIAPGVIWVAALLAALLGFERLYQSDYEDGSLDLMLTSPTPLILLVAAKAFGHWLLTGLPLLIAAPLVGIAYGLPDSAFAPLVLGLLLGTPALSLLGALGAALTLGARRGGVLLSLLVMPLMIPVLIFGSAAVDAIVMGMSARPHLLLLGAVLCVSLAVAPAATAAALREAVR